MEEIVTMSGLWVTLVLLAVGYGILLYDDISSLFPTRPNRRSVIKNCYFLNSQEWLPKIETLLVHYLQKVDLKFAGGVRHAGPLEVCCPRNFLAVVFHPSDRHAPGQQDTVTINSSLRLHPCDLFLSTPSDQFTVRSSNKDEVYLLFYYSCQFENAAGQQEADGSPMLERALHTTNIDEIVGNGNRSEPRKKKTDD
jgi:hypothetical protein